MFGAALSLALPVAALVASARWVGRPRSEDPLAWPCPRGFDLDAASGAAGLVALAALVLAPILQSPALQGLFFASWIMIFAADIRLLSRRRQAAQTVVIAETASFWAMPAYLGPFFLGSHNGIPVADRGPVWIALLFLLACSIAAAWFGRRAFRLRSGVGLLIAVSGVFLVLGALGLVRSRPLDRQDAVDWIAGFDASVDDLTAWDAVGRTARWLRQEEGATLPTDGPAARRVREAIAAGVDVHPATFVAAFDAGFLRPQDLEPLRGSQEHDWARGLLKEEGPLRPTISTPEHLRLLLGLGEVDEEAKSRLVERLVAAGPAFGGNERLDRAYDWCVSLELLGAPERIEPRRDELWALLKVHACENGTAWRQPGGFAAYVREGERCFPSADATWCALAIMDLVGVPDGVDLYELQGYVRRESARFLVFFDSWNPLDGLDRDEALVRLRFDVEHDLPLRAIDVLGNASFPVAVLCLLALGLLLGRRSPPARLIPNPDLQPRWPKHVLDAFPELRREDHRRRQR